MPKIWYTTDFYRGGLGDFLCGALGIYHFCRQANIEFDIYIPAAHPLSKCFNIEVTKPQAAKQIIMNAEIYTGATVRKLLTKEMRGFSLKVIIVSTNVPDIATESEMISVINDFTQILRPSAALNTQVSTLKTALGIENSRYICIHARCGDAYMSSATINMRDNRMDITTAIQLIHRITALLSDIVIVHTDSMTLRNGIKCSDHIKVCDTMIQHTGEPNNQELGYLQTVAEFYIMCGAAEIYCTVPSGFSRFASLFRGITIKIIE